MSNTVDYQTIALWLLGVVMTLLSFLGLNLWSDVKSIKEKWVTKEEFNASNQANKEERDSKHEENTGNFRRLEEKIDEADQRHHEGAMAIEKRIGQVFVKIAELRQPQRPDGPDRRHY